MSWGNFKIKSPELAKSGERLLKGNGEVAIGFLSTCTINKPHIAPVCPIFCAADIYICAAEKSPKTKDLRRGGNYTLHAFLGKNDEEFQTSGKVREVIGEEERASLAPFGVTTRRTRSPTRTGNKGRARGPGFLTCGSTRNGDAFPCSTEHSGGRFPGSAVWPARRMTPECRFAPRLQWRDRVGIAPTSLGRRVASSYEIGV